MSEPFIGEVRIWACSYAPRGWAFCDGQILSISENTSLFSILGSNYGGDGRSSFGLPNLKGRAPMHPESGPGLTPRRLSERSGTPVVQLDQTQIPQHDHALSGVFVASTSEKPGNDLFMGLDKGTAENIKYVGNTTVDTNLASEALAISGGSGSHENRQPLLAVNFCIALVGLYPSRS